LSEDPILAMREVEAIYGTRQVVPNPQEAWCIIPYRIGIGSAVDLTDQDNVDDLGTSWQELAGPWKPPYYLHGQAPTQQLGEAIFQDPDAQGVIFSSSKGGGKNVLIFPDKIGNNCQICSSDNSGVLRCIP
ncbi:MAG TPA: RES domain-containing protein, partial [Chloroflexota bacterium]|nr:RES domain-containing protein [Chloroflexota bacterium]